MMIVLSNWKPFIEATDTVQTLTTFHHSQRLNVTAAKKIGQAVASWDGPLRFLIETQMQNLVVLINDRDFRVHKPTLFVSIKKGNLGF